MTKRKMIINVSDIWQKYNEGEDETTLQSFIEELTALFINLRKEIEEQFGEDAQMEYDDIIFNIENNVNDDTEFDYYWNELLDWADDYGIVIETY